MIKKIILLLLGLIPFALGFLMNNWILQNPYNTLPYILIGVIFLVFWVMIGFISSKFEKTPLKTAIIANLPAIVILLLLMYQEVIFGQYWSSFIGDATQLYFLPVLNISTFIVGLFASLTSWSITVWFSSIIAFFLMFASYYFGSYLRNARGIRLR